MYLIHDYSLHDNPKAYYNPTENNYLSGIDISSKKFERNLKLVNYNSSKDILFFISDHGLNLYPYSKMHLDKKFTKESYNKYYLDLMSDVKLKTTFFFKYPRNKPAKISIPVKPKNVNQIIKILINKNYKKKLQNFYKIIRIKNNNILLSLRAADSDPYNNFVFKNLFHCHLLFIKKGKKISFSHNHPKKFYNHLTKKYIDYSDDFTYYINEYYSINEKIRKFLFYVISLIYRLLSKLLN